MIESVVKRDRTVVVLGLITVIALCWLYLLSGAGMDMPNDMSGNMPRSAIGVNWSVGYASLMLAMWWIMMIAMMLPSAAPMILLFATVNRNNGGTETGGVPTILFVAGYVLVWGGFSVFATLAQWLLTSFSLLNAMMEGSSPVLNGLLLVLAGVYQFTPLKKACLRHCRSPIQFVMGHWLPGSSGALRMGMLHGMFCLGCCWFLMGLLFVGGVMNIAWIAGLAIYVLIEKIAPFGSIENWPGKTVGSILIIWGAYLIFGAYIGHPVGGLQ